MAESRVGEVGMDMEMEMASYFSFVLGHVHLL